MKRLYSLWSHDSWVRPFVRRYRKALLLAIALGVAAGICSVGLMFVAGYLLSGTAERPDWIFSLVVPLAFVQIFGIVRPFFSYAERLASHDWVLRMTSALRARLFRSLAAGEGSASRLRGAGDALGLAADDIAHVQDLYVRSVLPVVVGLVLWLACSIALGFFSVPFALIMLLLMGVVTVVAPLVSMMAAGARTMAAKRDRERLYADATDDVMGLADWVCSGRRDDFIAHVATSGARAQANDARARSFARRRDLAAQLVGGIAVLIATVWAAARFGVAAGFVGGVGVYATDALGNAVWHATPADFVAAFAIAVFPLVDALLPLGDAAASAPAHFDAVDRLNQLPDPGPEPHLPGTDATTLRDLLGIRDPLAPVAAPADETPGRVVPDCEAPRHASRSPWLGSTESGTCANDAEASIAPEGESSSLDDAGSVTGVSFTGSCMAPDDARPVACAASYDASAALDLVFSGVSFAYGPNAPYALHDVDLAVPHGQTVAVLGPSGAGKSTLLGLAGGELAPAAGSVTLGGVDVHALGEGVHDLVGVIRQQPYVFDASLLQNLRVAEPDATEDECRDALARVGLLDAADALPRGLATRVGEGGTRLSGGQRHRLALARVLLRNTPVVLLDEPMAALDPLTESALLRDLLAAFEGRTVVMVTHHLLGVSAFDRVVFLEDGRIARDGGIPLDGSPAQLARVSPRYRRLLAFDRGEA